MAQGHATASPSAALACYSLTGSPGACHSLTPHPCTLLQPHWQPCTLLQPHWQPWPASFPSPPLVCADLPSPLYRATASPLTLCRATASPLTLSRATASPLHSALPCWPRCRATAPPPTLLRALLTPLIILRHAQELGGAPPPELMGEERSQGGPSLLRPARGMGGLGSSGAPGGPPGSDVPDECKLYVGNMPGAFDERMLRTMFEPFGVVAHASVMLDSLTGMSRGFGFVHMGTGEGARVSVCVGGLVHMGTCEGARVGGWGGGGRR